MDMDMDMMSMLIQRYIDELENLNASAVKVPGECFVGFPGFYV